MKGDSPSSRTCVFCASTDLTLEHVLPSWINGLHGGDRIRHSLGETVQWTARRLDFKARTVCADCNSGCMSQLEQRARPVLSRLILSDKTLILTPDDQAVIATWMTTTAMMFESVSRIPRAGEAVVVPEPFFRQDKRSSLRVHGRPPDGTMLWLGQYVGDRFGAHSSVDLTLPLDGSGPVEGEAFVSTFAVGHMAFQLLSIWGRAGMPDATSISMKKYSSVFGSWTNTSTGSRWNRNDSRYAAGRVGYTTTRSRSEYAVPSPLTREPAANATATSG